MRAGKLDTSITIQSRSTSRDALGGPVETWTNVATTWAEVQEQRGQEYAAGRLLQTQAVRTTILRTRYVANVDATMRVIEGSRTLQIVSVATIGRNEGLEIVAEAVNG
jgi:SPP1 family predicted phage head-tail adaptor